MESKTSSKNGTTPQLPLLFGVEIEHILATHTPPWTETRTNTSSQNWDSPSYYDSYELPMYPLNTLEYLCEQFSKHNLSSTTDGNSMAYGKKYATWLITTDGSIQLPSFENLQKQLPHLVERGWRGKLEWAMYSLELVSRPLRAPDVSVDGPAYLQDEDGGVGEVRRYVDVLHKFTKGSKKQRKWLMKDQTPQKRHTAFTNRSCGMHVHIGLPSKEALPLPVLQHLAYLLLQNEHIISSLHHHSRNPYPYTQAFEYARSNRISFLDWHNEDCPKGSGLDMREVRARVFEKGIKLRKLCWMMGSNEALDAAGQPRARKTTRSGVAVPEQAEQDSNAIAPDSSSHGESYSDEDFQASNSTSHNPDWDLPTFTPPTTASSPGTFHVNSEAQDTSPWYACSHFPTGAKYKLTRWDLLTRNLSRGPRTIEFRQAAGSVDAEEIGETVRLYVALIREAERRACEDVEAGRDIGAAVDASEGLTSSVDDLLKMLRLPNSAQVYWRRRARKCADERLYSLRDPSSLSFREKCSDCAQQLGTRASRRKSRNKHSRGWQAFLPGNSNKRSRWYDCLVRNLKQDLWWPEDEEEEKVAAPKMAPSKKLGKGKRRSSTRKERSVAKRKARAKARRAEQKAWKKIVDQHSPYTWGGQAKGWEEPAVPPWNPEDEGKNLWPGVDW